MKIITKKQTQKIADNLTNSIKNLFKTHGITPKQQALLSFNRYIVKQLGGTPVER